MKTMTDELRDNRTCSAVCVLVNAMRKTCLQHCWWLHAINSSPPRSYVNLWQGRFVPWRFFRDQQVDLNVQWIQYGNSWKVDQWVPKLSNTGDWPGLVQTPKFRCLLRPLCEENKDWPCKTLKEPVDRWMTTVYYELQVCVISTATSKSLWL